MIGRLVEPELIKEDVQRIARGCSTREEAWFKGVKLGRALGDQINAREISDAQRLGGHRIGFEAALVGAGVKTDGFDAVVAYAAIITFRLVLRK